MKLIAHRGNVNGRKKHLENTPNYILNALEKSFDAEIDVWYLNKKWYLGHDEAQYLIDYNFFHLNGLWIHAKNGDAFYELNKDLKINAFYHTDEDWVLTTKKFIWTYPNNKLYPNSICVMPENGFCGDIKLCYGICSDNIIRYSTQ